MSRDRVLYIVIAIVLAMLAALTVRAELATSAIVVGGPDNSDYALRHPNAVVPAGAPGASDWFERHPDSLNAANAVDLSDYAQRHPEMLRSAGSAGGDDWFLRHPDSLHGKAPDSSSAPLYDARANEINGAYQARFPNLSAQAEADWAQFVRSQGLNERYGLPRQ